MTYAPRFGWCARRVQNAASVGAPLASFRRLFLGALLDERTLGDRSTFVNRVGARYQPALRVMRALMLLDALNRKTQPFGGPTLTHAQAAQSIAQKDT